ncbi:hypothetical protein SV7mr_20020 [Stieleria bergensis]|uniref:HTH merR-type domain-containing protein n=1 Tax=Stieleria bergensis TaxID=2528025 RepID=A0A517STN5_9BACT|nr:hypothetical protein SV7mr_20020 [Planctomycetes bacterium SV_7m_r]
MKLFSIKDVSQLIGIDETRIHYCHRSGRVPEPQHVGNRRIYTPKDLKRVAEFFGVEAKQKEHEEEK